MEDQDKIYWTLQEAEGNLLGLLSDPIQDLLSDDELLQFTPMRVEKRKTEWLLGRLTAKSLVTSPNLPFAGVRFSSITIANHPEGAPFIAKPRSHGCLSISHRQNIAVCAFTPSPDMTIGIDIEQIESRELSFVEDFFTQSEADYTKQLQEETRHLWSTLVWSAKEAVLKAWQKGLRLDTRSIEVFPIDPEVLEHTSTQWNPIKWKANIKGFPQCWLGWQRWNNFVITLACTTLDKESQPDPAEIIRIQLENFPITN